MEKVIEQRVERATLSGDRSYCRMMVQALDELKLIDPEKRSYTGDELVSYIVRRDSKPRKTEAEREAEYKKVLEWVENQREIVSDKDKYQVVVNPDGKSSTIYCFPR